jgi:hypothetical protein
MYYAAGSQPVGQDIYDNGQNSRSTAWPTEATAVLRRYLRTVANGAPHDVTRHGTKLLHEHNLVTHYSLLVKPPQPSFL